MEVSEAIRRRRSIKKYHDMKVDQDKIMSLIDGARLAPSAGNLQPWKFIVVEDEGKRKKIAEACFQQYWMETAPVYIVICAEVNKMSRFYGLRGERLYSIQSCALAAENIMLEAVDMGLGTCFVSAFDEGMMRNIFNLPDFARPQAVITLGYPAEETPQPPKYTLDDVAFLEGFGGRIRDVDQYTGYAWARRVQETVNMARDALNDASKGASKKGESIFKKASDGIKKKIKDYKDNK